MEKKLPPFVCGVTEATFFSWAGPAREMAFPAIKAEKAQTLFAQKKVGSVLLYGSVHGGDRG
jgi:hypothetical protein